MLGEITSPDQAHSAINWQSQDLKTGNVAPIAVVICHCSTEGRIYQEK